MDKVTSTASAATEPTFESNTVGFWGLQYELGVSEAVITLAWQRGGSSSIVTGEVKVDVGSDLDLVSEPCKTLGGGDDHAQALWATSGAVVVGNVISLQDGSGSNVGGTGRVGFVVAVATVAAAVTDEQVANALGIVTTTAEMASTAAASLKVTNAELEVIGVLLEQSPLWCNGVVPVVIDLGHGSTQLRHTRLKGLQLGRASASTTPVAERLVKLANASFLICYGGCVCRGEHRADYQQAPHV